MNKTAHTTSNDKHETLRSKAEDLKNGATAWAEDELNAVRKIGTKSLKEAEAFAKEALTEASAEIVSLEKKATAFVRKNPYFVLGAAVAIGFIIAKIIRRPTSHAQR